jgi:heterodisulfide reductase subunit C
MDIYPDKVIRLVNIGQMDRVLNCRTIWICSACETCTTRCPNEVDIAGVMDHLKEMALCYGIRPSQTATRAFHDAFLREIEKRGRVFEGGLMHSYMLRSGELWRKLGDFSILEDLALGMRLFLKGRMPLRPEGIKGKKEVKDLISKKP